MSTKQKTRLARQLEEEDKQSVIQAADVSISLLMSCLRLCSALCSA
jgi:hypothetical protein